MQYVRSLDTNERDWLLSDDESKRTFLCKVSPRRGRKGVHDIRILEITDIGIPRGTLKRGIRMVIPRIFGPPIFPPEKALNHVDKMHGWHQIDSPAAEIRSPFEWQACKAIATELRNPPMEPGILKWWWDEHGNRLEKLDAVLKPTPKYVRHEIFVALAESKMIEEAIVHEPSDRKGFVPKTLRRFLPRA